MLCHVREVVPTQVREEALSSMIEVAYTRHMREWENFTEAKPTGAVPELVLAGQDYLRVRVLSSPATLVIMALQAGLLAQKDSFTPLLAILISVSSPKHS